MVLLKDAHTLVMRPFSNSQNVVKEVKHRIRRQFIAKIAAGASTQTQSRWALGLGSDLVWFTDCTPAAPSLCSICDSAFGFRPDLSDSCFGTFWTRDDKSSNHSVLWVLWRLNCCGGVHDKPCHEKPCHEKPGFPTATAPCTLGWPWLRNGSWRTWFWLNLNESE